MTPLRLSEEPVVSKGVPSVASLKTPSVLDLPAL
jgi:hypothetical protein